ncbi:HNH endonuclease [Neisseria leonii]|uniref:HNH endonuclease n=1 Tax=Neisseria leonii TaxID=2995413 RepID=UPI00237B534C|nr:HNH endonuclease [Neisseria sp. 3986]MDD9326403.1 HNH endonuclease [Neisseria sp. 3986]
MEKKRNWTREETLIALYLYYTIPFQKVSKGNKTIQSYAALINRTPSALGMKIGNLGRFDPTLKAQNISGLSNGSKMDEMVWREFEGQWEKLDKEFQSALAEFDAKRNFDTAVCEKIDFKIKNTERLAMISVRANQNFFRASVLAAYNNQCCITGIDLPELLVASHIKPWKSDEANRLNPKNGLCLNALHDKAFDRGLLTLENDFRLIFSPKLHQVNSDGFEKMFKPYEGKSIRLPERLEPDLSFIEYHRTHIFVSR